MAIFLPIKLKQQKWQYLRLLLQNDEGFFKQKNE
jgi:hypothetical protein